MYLLDLGGLACCVQQQVDEFVHFTVGQRNVDRANAACV